MLGAHAEVDSVVRCGRRIKRLDLATPTFTAHAAAFAKASLTSWLAFDRAA
jgi:hypothetical protein